MGKTESMKKLIEVTKSEFFAHIGQRDIICNLDRRDCTDWETRNRTLVGRTYPGWANPQDKKVYMITVAANNIYAHA